MKKKHRPRRRPEFECPQNPKVKEEVLTGSSPQYISKIDFDRLNESIRIAREMGEGRNIVLGRLKKALKEAKIVLVEKMPKNVVTMNSAGKILWLDTREVRLFWLGFPNALDHDGNKVSIFSSLGIALLGSRVGEDAAQEVPTGHRLFQVVKLLYQPEAKRDYHL